MKTNLALELKDDGDVDPSEVVTKALTDLNKTVDERIKAIETKSADRLDKLEARLNRPTAPKADNDNAEGEIEKKAFNSFIRGGVAALDDVERKTLNLTTQSAGGYVVVPGYSMKIIEKLTQFSPLRGLASTMQIGGTEIYLPTLEENVDTSDGWVTETGNRTATEPEFGQLNIKVYENAKYVPISQQLLEDSGIDLFNYVAGQLGKMFGKTESSAFIKGDGNGKPTGLLHTPTDYASVTADQDKSDIIEKLIEAFYKLPGAYASQGSWLMKRETMGIIRAAADTTIKGTLWSDGLANGTPATLLGRPVYEAVDMDDFVSGADPAVATYPIAFGDYASAYQIVDRIQTQFQRDDFTGADNGIVKIRARRRVGGKPILNEAVILVKAAP